MDLGFIDELLGITIIFMEYIMEFSKNFYNDIKIKTNDEVKTYTNTRFTEFYTKIYQNHNKSKTKTYSFLDKCIFGICMRFFPREYYRKEGFDFNKFDQFKDSIYIDTELGKTLKEYPFTFLTKFPEKSLQILNSCEDHLEYCFMNITYIFADYKEVKYVCDSNNEDDIKIINTKEDLDNVKNKRYLYNILPSKKLCLFSGHHSSGACGQPVISAGYVTIKDNKIIDIDNSSGHYAPPLRMLQKGIDILFEKGLIETNKDIDTINSESIMKVQITSESNEIMEDNFCKDCKDVNGGKKRSKKSRKSGKKSKRRSRKASRSRRRRSRN